jgi:hypothetical protein
LLAPFSTLVAALLVENEFFIRWICFFHFASDGVNNPIVLWMNLDSLMERVLQLAISHNFVEKYENFIHYL